MTMMSAFALGLARLNARGRRLSEPPLPTPLFVFVDPPVGRACTVVVVTPSGCTISSDMGTCLSFIVIATSSVFSNMNSVWYSKVSSPTSTSSDSHVMRMIVSSSMCVVSSATSGAKSGDTITGSFAGTVSSVGTASKGATGVNGRISPTRTVSC
eukprot:Amastigsp_a342865_12.p3 type:complete len:155 gc:universal Amastigsp_a342865_12:809-1273(+)